MAWYVTTGGQPIGPLDDAGVIAAIHGGLRPTGICQAGTQQWLPPHAYPPFAVALGFTPPGPAQAAPARKRRKVWPWVVGGIFLFFVLVGALAKPPSAAEITQRAEKEQADMHARAVANEAQHQADMKADNDRAVEAARVAAEAKRCPGGGKGTRVDDGDFIVTCEDLVRNNLLSPSSADFAGMFNRIKPIEAQNCSKTWASWVDAKNAFGVEIRKQFACTYDSMTQRVSLVMP